MTQLTIQQGFDLALQHHQAGRLQDAEQLYRQILARQPGHADALHLLGVIAYQVGRKDAAVDLIRQAILIKPNYAEAYSNLGSALRDRGQLDEAIAAFRQAIALNPNLPETHSNLGNALSDKGQLDEALTAYRQAIALRPTYAEAHYNLGNALKGQGQLDAAIAAYRQAIALKPDFAKAHSNLGAALKDNGQLDEAIATYRRVMVLAPEDAVVHSNLVYTLHFHPAYDAQAIYEEASRWNQRHAAPLARLIRPHPIDRDAERPLRIGYVSADFRGHPVGYNFLPLALAHDHRQFRLFCYSGVLQPDEVTARLRGLADEWRDTRGLSDEQLAEVIRQDRIDILVDFTMHMAHNRLLVFARKPAPVQATALCSMGTTGLTAMDYRISDRYSDPPAFNDAYYSEETVRLPDCYFCHEVPPESPPVSAVPASQAGYITFGSLNNFCKVTPPVLEVWGQILAAVPMSRLLLRCPAGRRRSGCGGCWRHGGSPPSVLSSAGSGWCGRRIFACTTGWTSTWTRFPIRGTRRVWMRCGWGCRWSRWRGGRTWGAAGCFYWPIWAWRS